MPGVAASPVAAPRPALRRPIRLRLVIGCGGIRPVATVPLIEFLDRQGIVADEVVGCSGGGVVASLYALGLPGTEIRAVITRLLQRRMFAQPDFAAPLRLATRRRGSGLLRPDRILESYRQAFGDHRVEALPRRLLLQATDFDSRRGVVLSQGSVVEALYASTAAYPLLPPIRIGRRWLFDGAFSAPLPLGAGRGLADLTLAVSINPSPHAHRGHRLLGLPAEVEVDPAAVGSKPRLMVLRMPIDRRISWWHTHLVPEIMAAGERAVAQQAAAICAALEAAANSNLDQAAAEQYHH